MMASGKYLRPYFCSQRCADKAIESAFKHHLYGDEFYADQRKWEKEQYDRKRAEAEFKYQSLLFDLEQRQRNGYDTFQRQIDAELLFSRETTQLEYELGRSSEQIEQAHAKSRELGLLDAKQTYLSNYDEARFDHQMANKPPFPPAITDEQRFEHTHILGPTGSGKTTLLAELILNDLNRDDRPAIIVIEPKRSLTSQIARLQQFDPSKNRGSQPAVVLVDPTSHEPPPPNIFQTAHSPELINQSIANFDYIFSQANAPLTPQDASGV